MTLFHPRRLPLLALALGLTSPLHAASVYVHATASKSKTDVLDDVCVRMYSDYNDLACKDGRGFRVGLGVEVTPYFAIEAGYRKVGEFSARESNPSWYREHSAEVSGNDLMAVAQLPLPYDFKVFGKLGVVGWKVESAYASETPSIPWSYFSSDTDSGTSTAYAAGVSWKWFMLERSRIKDVGKEDTTGKGDIDSWSAGLRIGF